MFSQRTTVPRSSRASIRSVRTTVSEHWIPIQPGSPLLNLPREVRDDIFDIFFTSTRLTYGMRYSTRHGERFIRPAPHSMAILRVCQQIYAEVRHIWMEQVLFNFEDPQTMLNKLSALPDSTLSRIHFLRLTGSPMMRYLKGFDDLMYRHDSIFQLLPALRLDCLTILTISPAAPEYDAVSNLISRGNGWKELRYITRSSRMLGFSPSRTHGSRETGDICRQPQPACWNQRLLSRDGERSGASVEIFRAHEEDHTESVLCPDSRDQFEQTPDESMIREFGLVDNEELTRGHGARRALLVTVKRGCTTDIGQRSTGYGKERDMKARFHKRTWRTRKKVIIWTPLDEDKNDDDDVGTGWARPLIRQPLQAFDDYHDIDDM